MDIGCDVAYGAAAVDPRDPLRERTPMPSEDLLPKWRASCADYYLSMERVCRALMHSLARSLGLSEDYFDHYFREGLSTLRLLRYPPRSTHDIDSCPDPGIWVSEPGRRRYVTGVAHTDSGFLTLLAQDGVAGLQARDRSGRWIEVPPREDGLVVNFGQVLERWSGGRIRATEHRVLGHGVLRHSIPFFYEARADAVIAPLPIDDPCGFEPFVFGDYLWQRICGFVEFRGMEHLRPVRNDGVATRNV